MTPEQERVYTETVFDAYQDRVSQMIHSEMTNLLNMEGVDGKNANLILQMALRAFLLYHFSLVINNVNEPINNVRRQMIIYIDGVNDIGNMVIELYLRMSGETK